MALICLLCLTRFSALRESQSSGKNPVPTDYLFIPVANPKAERKRGDSKYLFLSNHSKRMSMQIVEGTSISSKQFWKSIEGKILICSYQWPGNILDVGKITNLLGARNIMRS